MNDEEYKTGSIKYVEGDITNYPEADYICQQNDCVSHHSYSLSYTIAVKLGVDPYEQRCITSGIGIKSLDPDFTMPDLGTIQFFPATKKDKNVTVICMYAQKGWGSIESNSTSRLETFQSREKAFQECLNQINEEVERTAVIAFPYAIGCGHGGGSWLNYQTMITDFAQKNRRTVRIVAQPSDEEAEELIKRKAEKK